MGTRSRLVVPVLLAGWLAACSDSQGNQPLSPATDLVHPSILSSCTVAQDSIDAILPQLFTPGSERGQSVSTDNQMNKALRKDDKPLALKYMKSLIDLTLQSYYANPSQITGGRSANSTRRVQDLISGLLCVNNLGLIDPILDPNGAAAIVLPGTDATVAIPDPAQPGLNVAATTIKASDLPPSTPAALVTITPVAGPLDTKLDQYGPFYEFNITPHVGFVNPVLTGACINTTGLSQALQDRLLLAHNHSPSLPVAPGNSQFGNIEIIAPAPLTSLNLGCAPLQVLGFMNKLQIRLQSMFLPDPLYAVATGSGGAGGKVTNYSPFAAVDPLLTLSANPASTSGTAGSPVSTPPSVTVATANHVLVDGVNVGFAVTAGTGTVAPASVSTGTNGVASTTSWILSVGNNTVVATPGQAGLSFTSGSVSFAATGVAAGVPFQSSGWFYRQIGNLDPVPSDWTTIDPTVANGWTPGTAAFGTPGCGLPAPTTPWELNTTILLRRDVFVPLGTASMTIDVLIDNDLYVFVNGTNLTGAGLLNGGCADTHPISITVPGPGSDGPLVPGQLNKVFIRGVDRGVQSYLDAKITFVPASP